jgi:hypothetical protein
MFYPKKSTDKIIENCVLLGYYAAINDNFLPTFRDNLSVPSHLQGSRMWILNP